MGHADVDNLISFNHIQRPDPAVGRSGAGVVEVIIDGHGFDGKVVKAACRNGKGIGALAVRRG